MEELVQLIIPYITALSVSVPRIISALLLVPLFSLKLVHGLPRYAVIVAIALPISITLTDQIEERNLGMVLLGIIMLKESAIGFIIGFLLALPFWMFQSIGVMIDNQRGALSGGYFNPGAGPDSSMLGELMAKALVILLIVIGAFPAMFGVLIESYILWPPLEWMPAFADNGYEYLIGEAGNMLYKFVLYAGPIILVLLLIEAGFAILGAYSPQLQVYFMAMPAKSLVALLILVLYCSTLWYLGGAELMEYHNLKAKLANIFLPLTAN